MKRNIVIGILALATLVVGGPFVYTKLIAGGAPAPLGLSSPNADAPAAAGSTDGRWTVADGSQVGYRVDEILFGQEAVAVGRTEEVTGSLTADGATITEASFTVDMASVTSDQSRRDNQFRGRIMDTATYPTATFELTEPIDIASVPADGEDVHAPATGELTVRGTTKQVTFEVTGRLSGGRIEVAGSIPIVFAEWNIPNPSFGPARTGDEGVLEFSLRFEPAT